MSPRKHTYAIACVSISILLSASYAVSAKAMETARIAEIKMPDAEAVSSLVKTILNKLGDIGSGSPAGAFGEYVRDARQVFDRWSAEAIPEPKSELPPDSSFIAEASSMFDTLASWISATDRFLAELFSLEAGKRLLSAIAGLFATVWGAIVFGATWFWDHILGVMVKSTTDAFFFWK